MDIEESQPPFWGEDFNLWWAKQLGYKEPGIEFTEKTTPLFHESWEEKRMLIKRNPCPVQEIIHCSYEYPMYILSIPETRIIAYCGDPVLIDVKKLQESITEAKKLAFLEFCKKYDVTGEPRWWLVSMWG